MSAAPNQGSTVTLAVVQGESPNPTATFSQAMAARQVVVGSGAAAQWKVRAPGVEPAHVELYWDGAALWVRDGGSLSGVYLGNDRALDWAQITDGIEVSFGQCVLRAKVTGPGAVAAPVAAPKGAASAAFIDEEESTMVFSNAQDLVKAAEQMHAARTSAPAVPQLPAIPGMSGGAAARPATMAPQRPAAPHSYPPPAPPAPPAHAPEMDPAMPPKPPPSEATVIRPSPYAALLEGGPSGGNHSAHPPLPGGGGPLPTVMVAGSQVGLPAASAPGLIRPATMAPPLVGGGLQPAPMSPAVPPPPMGPMQNMGPMGPMGPMQNMGPMGPSPNMGPMGPMGPMQNMGPMGPPPNMGPMGAPPMQPQGGVPASGFGDDPFGTLDIPKGPAGGGKTVGGVPARTLVLAGVTLLVGVGGLFINPQQPPAAQRPATQGGRGAAVSTNQRVLTQGAAPPATNNVLGLPIGPPGIVGVVVPPPMQAVDAQGRPRPLPAPNLQDPIRLAAEAVNAHRYDDAIRLYEQLAAQHPEAPLFRQFVVVLRARANQQGCVPGAPGCPTPTESPGTATPPPAAPSPQ